MAKALKDRSMHKYYQCLVSGRIEETRRVDGYLWKDPSANKVQILKKAFKDAQPIATEYRPVRVFSGCTLLEVCLITGRSHQIRSHLASEGHPIIGDYKYGIRKVNDFYYRQYGLQSQLLHSCRLELPRLEPPLTDLSGKIFTAELPKLMRKIIVKESEREI